MSNIKSNIKNAFWYTAVFKMLRQLLSIVGIILLVKILSENDYGIYNLFYSLIATFGMFASLGIMNTVQRYIPEYYGRGEFLIAHRLYRTASMVRLFSNIICLGLILILWDILAPVLKIEAYINYYFIFSIILLAHFQWGLVDTCLSAYFKHKLSQATATLFVLIKVAGYGFALVTGGGLLNVFFIEIAAYAILTIVLQIIYWKYIPTNSGTMTTIPNEERKRLLRYAVFYNFNDAGSSIISPDFDNFLLVIYLNPIAVGGYALCQRLTKLIQQLIPVQYMLDVIRPAYFIVGMESEQSRRIEIYQMLVKITLIVMVPAFVTILVAGKDLMILFFNQKFSGYSTVLSGVLFFSLLNSFQLPLGLAAMLRERSDIILYSKIFAFYNIVAAIILIPLLNIWGAVIATGTATLGKNIFIWYFNRQEASFAGMGRFMYQLVLFWCCAGTIIWSVAAFLGTGYVLNFVICCFGVLICSVIQFRVLDITPGERKLLGSVIDKNSTAAGLFNLIIPESSRTIIT